MIAGGVVDRSTTRPVAQDERRLAFWPLVAIFVLCSLSILPSAAVVSVLNGVLLCAALVVVVGSNQRIDPRLWHLIVPFALILCAGLASGVGSEQYEYLKDAWYICNPVFVMLTGYILFKVRPDLPSGLMAFVWAGVFIGLFQIHAYAVDPGLITRSAFEIRQRIGTGFTPPVLAATILIVLAGRWRSYLRLAPWWGVPLALILAACLVGTFSRTALLVALVAGAAWAGCFARQEWLRLGVPAVFFVVLLLLLEALLGRTGGADMQSFLGKLSNTLREIAFDDTATLREIHTNFRGFESAQALKQVMDGTPVQILFGQGFGTMIDLGIFIPLGSVEGGMPVAVRMIPVLHNGYLYVLVKGGVLAVAAYLYVLAYFYWVGRASASAQADDTRYPAGRLLQALTVALALTTYVVSGAFNKNAMFSFLLCIGFLLAALDPTRHGQRP